MNFRGVVAPQDVSIDGTNPTVVNEVGVEEVLSANSSLEDVSECNDMVICGMASCQSLINLRQGSGVLGEAAMIRTMSCVPDIRHGRA